MGTWSKGKKEFWWEREWRKRGDLFLGVLSRTLVLCPEIDHQEILEFIRENDLIFEQQYKIIDPAWSLEQIIAQLAGFKQSDVTQI